jgi:SsrA-binding protein|tara:strand:- start:798 stop:1259 length:462 start_codon:yes stop_codon:yes gene_type:complete
MKNSINIKNRKAKYDYHVLDTYVSGIVLSGNEIKSIRESNASLNNCYCEFDTNNELYIINMNIDEYVNSNEKDYSPQKKRKLLLNKNELKKLTKESINPGITIVPLNLFINNKGLAKITIAIAKGKKEFDKRNVIKDRENKINLKRISKGTKD